MLSLVAAAGLAAGLVALPTTAADGATVKNQYGYIEYAAAAGETNNITVSRSASSYVITDNWGITMTPTGCTVSGNTATCPADGVSTIYVYAGDMNDTITMTASMTSSRHYLFGENGNDQITAQAPESYEYMAGGAGDDVLSGGGGNDELSGEADSDSINAGPGNDRLSGAGGNDTLLGEAGNDVLAGQEDKDTLAGGAGYDILDPGNGGFDTVSGGPERDTVLYNRAAPVNVSLNDQPDDGETGESDNVASDVEALHGGVNTDVLTGSGDRNWIYGNGGDDTINGAGGNDRLYGQGGNNTLNGEAGDDSLYAEGGADTFSGGPGADYVPIIREFDVWVSLNGVADDGEMYEGDNVMADVEEVVTGAGDDMVVGANNDNEFSTGEGNDTISASGGSDGVDAGQGRDKVTGGKGIDSLHGGAGPDTINSKDRGKDYVSCGGSLDVVTRDTGDQVTVDCEKLK